MGPSVGLFAEIWGTSEKTAPNTTGTDVLIDGNHAAILQPESVIQNTRD